jgi:hypothetical protein
MYGVSDLKDRIEITTDSVECPVRGCETVVERQSKYFRRAPEFFCPDHAIYISPSTFEYETESANLLWNEPRDVDLLGRISRVKRESRIARDNSEDALSWNVFRFLERTNNLAPLLASCLGESIVNPGLVYWSYSPNEDSTLADLNDARREFGEVPSRGSEPDLIVVSDSVLIFIEAKLFASNNTTPSRSDACDAYKAGGARWASRVFQTDLRVLSEEHKKYELARFWLLGSWMAERRQKRFRLVNLVPDARETDIVDRLSPHLHESSDRTFSRMTWEQARRWVDENRAGSEGGTELKEYLLNKSGGYSNGRLKRAFRD